MRDMEWYVFVEDFNNRKIYKYNVFNHSRYLEDIKKIYKKHRNDFDTFTEEVRRTTMYYYWSKCEWEIILSSWPPRPDFNESRIDVYDQIMMNWNVFIKYVWDMCHARKDRKHER